MSADLVLLGASWFPPQTYTDRTLDAEGFKYEPNSISATK
jgi:hypothetical protein